MRTFSGLATELAGTAYHYDLATGAARCAGELAHTYALANRLKALEIDYILQCIDGMRANANPEDLMRLCNARLDAIALIAAEMHTASSRHVLCRC